MIQIMYKQGYSKKHIARELGISINTVKKYIHSSKPPSYSRRSTKPSKLASYERYIQSRIAAAKPHWIPATVLFKEIQARGYSGSLSLLRQYMQRLKPQSKEAPLVRFETAPGQQMQVDWAEFRKGKHRLAAFIATLGYSRASYVEFVTNEKLDTLIQCHQHAFDYFGGVPQQILYDNMKTVIIKRDNYGPGRHRFQPGFWDFAKHYNFMPKVCKPYRAQTKGKVERFIHYLKYSFYHPLAAQLHPYGQRVEKSYGNQKVRTWLNQVANQRIHGTTGERPFQRLQQEQAQLQPLPFPYCGGLPQARVVSESKQRLPSSHLETEPLQHQLSLYEDLLASMEAFA